LHKAEFMQTFMQQRAAFTAALVHQNNNTALGELNHDTGSA